LLITSALLIVIFTTLNTSSPELKFTSYFHASKSFGTSYDTPNPMKSIFTPSSPQKLKVQAYMLRYGGLPHINLYYNTTALSTRRGNPDPVDAETTSNSVGHSPLAE
ncbi:hypothetical protein PV328_011788, partial [Microctonus aethiopoides]